MDNDIAVLSDGDGLAVIGEPGAVERFVVSAGMPSKDLGAASPEICARDWGCSHPGGGGHRRQRRSLGEADAQVRQGAQAI